MVSIYCLVDPRNNQPFYVGATRNKLNIRLCGHLNTAKETIKYNNPYNQDKTALNKALLIFDIMRTAGKRPRIIKLLSVQSIEANHYEEFFYSMFLTQGFRLLQQPTAFSYHEARTNSRFAQKRHMETNSNRQITVHPIYFSAYHNVLGINHVIVYICIVNQ
jgi:hypothetical protein